MLKIGIVNYGMGNIGSVFNAIEFLGQTPVILDTPAELKAVDKFILPGVGAFSEAMKLLKQKNWCEQIRIECLEYQKPVLGICLGMQLLATESYEFGHCEGLDLIGGSVRKLSFAAEAYRLPHIGWNTVSFKKNDTLYAQMEAAQDFYFVHSYAFQPQDECHVSGICNYGVDFTASVEKENIFGTQYHPEKSHKMGLKVLDNFMKYGGM